MQVCQILVRKDLADSFMSVGIQQGIISPAGGKVSGTIPEAMKRLTELNAPTIATAQELNSIAVIMQASLLLLNTALVPMQIKAEAQNRSCETPAVRTP